jgi:hypothetical protein
MQPKLQSKIKVEPLGLKLDYRSKLLLAGSCFAENIGKKLIELKFDCWVNPLGISYNPISQFNLLERSLAEESFEQNELDFANERHFTFDLHSQFSSAKAQEVLSLANEQLRQQAEILKHADCLVLSLGTAWVHILKKEKRLVNNCHKIPSKEFNKALLSVKDIVALWKNLSTHLNKQNPNLKVLFTVSPIRHLKDGFRENQLSKSTLHLAVDEICQQFENCFYFPSYEIMMDELRDYRFYDRDLLHPSPLAIDIIWEHFQMACMSESSRSAIEELQKLQSSIKHRPFNPNSKAHLDFLNNLVDELDGFEKRYLVDLEVERNDIQNRIKQHPRA